MVEGAHPHLHCYRMSGKVIQDMQFFRNFTKLHLTLSKPSEDFDSVTHKFDFNACDDMRMRD